MLQTSGRDPFQVLDWIMSRRVHEYLDVAGRPVGEGRAAAFQHVQTDMQSCPYAGSRHHHDKPMNVTALRQIMPVWEQILTMLSWLSRRYRDWQRREVTTYDDLSLVTSAGVFLADFLVLRCHKPLCSHGVPVLISGLYKVCLGFQLAAFLGAMRERYGTERPGCLPDSAGFYALLEADELLIGEAEVCSGSAAMIMQAYGAITERHAIEHQALPAQCTNLEIAWEQFDIFAHHAANMWDELVAYVIQAPQFFPELADPRLPQDVQHRLNDCLRRRGTQLRAGQKGLVVDVARAAQDYSCRPTALQSGPTEPPGPSGSLPPNSLAAIVLGWLSDVAGADLQTHAPVVATALQSQLASYESYEATVLAGLNRHLSRLLHALGTGGAEVALTASALSHVCGLTLRDWGDRSW
jgi:hypothetical protein